MPDYNIPVSDLIITSEKIDVLDNATRRITTSDTSITSERVDILRAGARNVVVSDSTQTSEFADELKAGARFINVSEMSFTTENITFSILTNPSLINRTIPLTIVIPAALPFIVTKKNI